MRLQSIAMRITSRVKPTQPVTVINSEGYVTGVDGSRIPVESQANYEAQVQSASGDTIREFAGTHSSGDLRVLYLKNVATLVNRVALTSSSVFVFGGYRWRAIRIDEDWAKDIGDWAKVLVVMQGKQPVVTVAYTSGNSISLRSGAL